MNLREVNPSNKGSTYVILYNCLSSFSALDAENEKRRKLLISRNNYDDRNEELNIENVQTQNYQLLHMKCRLVINNVLFFWVMIRAHLIKPREKYN